MNRAFGKNLVLFTVLFYFGVYGLSSFVIPVATYAKCAKYYTPVSAPAVAPAQSQPNPSLPLYGSCSTVFPNVTGVVMPSVGNINVQDQNMAQVSCGPQPSLSFWVASVNNDCNTPACFTSAGVACTPGTAGCPCTVVTACTPRVFTAPLACLMCPPMPCLVCPPPPPPPPPALAANATAATGTANVTAPAPAAAPVAVAASSPPPPPPATPATPAAAGRRLMRSSHTSGLNHPGGPSRNVAPSTTCTTDECRQCKSSMVWLHYFTAPVLFALLLFAGYNRSQLHAQYGIKKEGCEDSYLPWLVCWPCALCQEARTIDVMEREHQLVHGMHNPQSEPLLTKAA